MVVAHLMLAGNLSGLLDDNARACVRADGTRPVNADHTFT